MLQSLVFIKAKGIVGPSQLIRLALHYYTRLFRNVLLMRLLSWSWLCRGKNNLVKMDINSKLQNVTFLWLLMLWYFPFFGCKHWIALLENDLPSKHFSPVMSVHKNVWLFGGCFLVTGLSGLRRVTLPSSVSPLWCCRKVSSVFATFIGSWVVFVYLVTETYVSLFPRT